MYRQKPPSRVSLGQPVDVVIVLACTILGHGRHDFVRDIAHVLQDHFRDMASARARRLKIMFQNLSSVLLGGNALRPRLGRKGRLLLVWKFNGQRHGELLTLSYQRRSQPFRGTGRHFPLRRRNIEAADRRQKTIVCPTQSAAMRKAAISTSLRTSSKPSEMAGMFHVLPLSAVNRATSRCVSGVARTSTTSPSSVSTTRWPDSSSNCP